MGYLPSPLLERLSHSLHGPDAKQYPHADAHLRLILALSHKLKRPLHLDKLATLRHKFAADAVAMQSPIVWRQSENESKLPTKNSATVHWQDKLIANADDEDMTVRCYQHDDKNPDDVVMLFFHGGGFCIGDINTHHEFCHAVCTQTGWSVVSVDYRLAPEYPAPTALRDCLSAYACVVDHCQRLNASSSRIVLAGDSAGGCLAILVAQQVSAPDAAQWLNLGLDVEKIMLSLHGLPRPLAQLPLYPVTDIETDYPSWALYGQGLLLDHTDVEVFDSAYMQQSGLSQSHALVSPMHGNNTHMCPSYIVAAELDILRDEALAYAEQLKDTGIEVKTHTVLGAPHGFIHLMSIHKGLGHETNDIIKGFSRFLHKLTTTEGN